MNTKCNNRREILSLITLCFVLEATLIVSDVLTFKVTGFASVIFTIPALLYPLTYAVGDILTEAYGRRITLSILAIAISIEAISDCLISYAATVHQVFDPQYYSAFQYSMGKIHIAALGVVTGSILGFVTNTTVMYFLRSKFSYRSFPIRSVLSSLAGEIIFTITAFSIWFHSYTGADTNIIIRLIISSASLKVLFAMLYAYPAYFIVRDLIKTSAVNSDPLRITNVIDISDKPGHSTFEFQILGKRIGFTTKSRNVTLNMFYALNEQDQELVEADLEGNIINQLDLWVRSRHENSINRGRNERHWEWNSLGVST